MKLIFLDVDGVLNSVRSMVAWHKEWKATIGHFDSEYPYSGRRHILRNHIDEVAVMLMNRITDTSGAKYVISSAHRKHIPADMDGVRDLRKMQEYFSGFGLTGEVIGYTPATASSFRGTEIESWLLDHRDLDITHYVIVDDSSDMLAEQLEKHFVHTNAANGLSYDNFKQILTILDSKDTPN